MGVVAEYFHSRILISQRKFSVCHKQIGNLEDWINGSRLEIIVRDRCGTTDVARPMWHDRYGLPYVAESAQTFDAMVSVGAIHRSTDPLQ